MNTYIDFRENIDYEKLNEIAQIIKKGGVVVFPTETVYGIGTNGLNEEGIKKLYAIKNRPKDKPISLLVSNLDMVKQLTTDITEMEYKLMEKYFPGPLTIILKKSSIVPNILTSNSDRVGIRCPDSIIARKLIEMANVPIATSSANISGMKSGTNAKNIMEALGDYVDYYIDGGESPIGRASTVVQMINNKPKILRVGSITEQQLNCLDL